LKKHSVSIRGHQTSFSLEDPFCLGLQKIARSKSIPVAQLVMQIDTRREAGENLSSAIRVFVFQELTE